MFSADTDRSNYKPFLERLYQDPTPKKKRFSTQAPLFYPDKNMRAEDMFKTRELAMVSTFLRLHAQMHSYVKALYVQVMRGLLFGPSAIRAPHAKPAHKTVGRNWEIKCVTPGLIAFAATIVSTVFSSN